MNIYFRDTLKNFLLKRVICFMSNVISRKFVFLVASACISNIRNIQDIGF